MWDRTNQVIRGTYCGVLFRGVVRNSRVKLAGTVQHTVDLFEDIEVFGSPKAVVLILETDDFSVDCEHFADYNL